MKKYKKTIFDLGFRSWTDFLSKMTDDVFIESFGTKDARAFLAFRHIYCPFEDQYKVCARFHCKYKHENIKSKSYNFKAQ